MLATKLDIGKAALMRNICTRTFAASAAVQPQRIPPTERPFLPTPAGLKFTRLPSGLFLVTVDNRNPIARISLVFKAGTRYETTETRGIVHRVRNLLGLSTNLRTSIDFNYYVASLGGILSSTATRDNLSIDIQIPRSDAGSALQILNELVGEPFHVSPNELQSSTSQMWYEKNQLKDDWPAYSFEKLHKVAYRQQGLANSLLSPKYALGKHSAEAVKAFARRHLVTGNAVLVATGVDHEDALKFASNQFSLAKGPVVSLPASTKFSSGDVRKERAGTDLAMVHIATSSTGLSDVKGTLTFAVLANLLGTGPTTKWSEGGQGRLARAARKATSSPFMATATNCSYEDSGIFGVFYAVQWQDSAAVAKALIGDVRAIASDGVNEKDLQAAKNRLKYRLLSLAENDDYVVEDLGVQAASRQADIHSASDQANLVDSISVSDINQASKKLLSGKFALSAVGRLDKTPYSDELAS